MLPTYWCRRLIEAGVVINFIRYNNKWKRFFQGSKTDIIQKRTWTEMAQTLSACRLGYMDEATWQQKEPGVHYTGHIPYVSLWSQRTQCGQLYAEHLLQTTCIEQRDKRAAGCEQDVQGKLRKGDTSFNRVRYLFVIAFHSRGGGGGGRRRL